MSDEKSLLTGGHPESGSWHIRIPALLCICFLTFGTYFIYDMPGILGYGISCDEGSKKGAVPSDAKCFNDVSSSTTTSLKMWHAETGDDDSKMDHSECQSACWTQVVTTKGQKDFVNYTYFGLKGGSDCFCNAYMPNTTAPTDQTKNCWGSDALACQSSDDHTKESDRKFDYYCGGKGYMTVTSFTCPIQTVEMHFMDKGKSYSQTQNLSLYSVYSYPNMILCLLGGILVDKIGLRKSSILFLISIFTGQILFVIGVSSSSYPLMVLGRVFIGLGGESLTVSQSTYTARWFKRTGWMALAFGITLSFSRIGSSVAFVALPWTAANKSLQLAVIVGAAACAWSVVCAVLLAVMDLYGEKKKLVDEVEGDEPFRFKDLRSFGLELWLITGICLCYYVAVFPFNGYGKNFFHDKWTVDLVQASSWVGIYNIVSAVGSPIVGFLIDRAGRSLSMIFFGCALLVGCHLTMWLSVAGTHAIPIGSMVVTGISLTFLGASLWPAVPYVVEARVLGSAYGLMTAIQNCGLATIPLLIGIIQDHTKGMAKYYWCEKLLILMAGLACVLCVLLMFVNRARDGVLNCSPSLRQAKIEAREGSIQEGPKDLYGAP